MSETVWTKNIKEGLTQTSPISDSENTKGQLISNKVANFGNNVYVGKDINELILTGDPNPPKITSKPIDVEEDTTSLNQLNDLYNNFDPHKAKKLYTNGIRTIKNTANNVKTNIAGVIVGWFYDTFESPEAKNDMNILSSQISTWIAVIPMSYLIVINWWYIMAYTNYVIDFRKYIWNALRWPMAPPFYALELLNYYILTFRMDVDSRFPGIETSRNFIWHYRPIWFSLLHLILFGGMLALPVTNIMESTMTNTGIVFSIASVASIYYYCSLFMAEKWYEPFSTSGMSGHLLLAGGTIAAFLMMFAFIVIVCPVFLLYMVFLSYFVIFVFNGFWPPSIISICNQIFDELKEVPDIDGWGKFGNAVFQNFHSIYLLIIMSGFFIMHVTQALSFSNSSLIFIAILANFIICGLFAPSAVAVPFTLLNVLWESEKDVVPQTPPENTIEKH